MSESNPNPTKPQPFFRRPRHKALYEALALAVLVVIVVAGLASLSFPRTKKSVAPASAASRNAVFISVQQSPVIPPELLAGMQARMAGKCGEAITHFKNALKPEANLSKDDQERAWFWMGLCEYETKQNAAALESFQEVKNLRLSMATSVDVWITMAGKKGIAEPRPSPRSLRP
jgi:hypothetical protein